MTIRSMWTGLAVLLLASTAQAEIKFYSSFPDSGVASDSFSFSVTACPPVRTTLGQPQGFAELEDDGLGTVTLRQLELHNNNKTDLGEDFLAALLGPGAFIFVDRDEVRRVSVTSNTSNTSGIGAHGPSSSGASSSTEWGVISGWVATGSTFCVSSPTALCNQNGFAHGATVLPIVASMTYDLGTWNFDATADYEAEGLFVQRTSNGGLTNRSIVLRGTFHGASLPILPLVGLGALAVGLAVMGGRTLGARK